jgi:hypothetical protein
MIHDQANMSEQRSQYQQELAKVALAWAKVCEGDCFELLSLLRTLESLHRQIRDNLFQAALPDNRQKLYALLREIEENGGWPYIERMKLRQLLTNLEAEIDAQSASFPSNESKP